MRFSLINDAFYGVADMNFAFRLPIDRHLALSVLYEQRSLDDEKPHVCLTYTVHA
jgi:hypothetical protein